MVGWLVHDQQVGRGGAEAGERGLGLFAAGELADGLKREVAFQAEAGEQVANVVFDPFGIVFGPDGADHGGLGVKRAQALVVVADLDFVSELRVARGRVSRGRSGS